MGPKTIFASPLGTVLQSSALVDAQLGQMMWNGNDCWKLVKNVGATAIADKCGCIHQAMDTAGFLTYGKFVRIQTEGAVPVSTDYLAMAGVLDGGFTINASGSATGDRGFIKIFGLVASAVLSGVAPDTAGLHMVPGSSMTGALLQQINVSGFLASAAAARYAICCETHGVGTADVFVHCL